MWGRTLKLNYTLQRSYFKITYIDLTTLLSFFPSSYSFLYSFVLFLSSGAIILTFWSPFISTFDKVIYKLKKHSEKITKFWYLFQGHYRYKFYIWNFQKKFLSKKIRTIWKKVLKTLFLIFLHLPFNSYKNLVFWSIDQTTFFRLFSILVRNHRIADSRTQSELKRSPIVQRWLPWKQKLFILVASFYQYLFYWDKKRHEPGIFLYV